jgi:hypothetical protein
MAAATGSGWPGASLQFVIFRGGLRGKILFPRISVTLQTSDDSLGPRGQQQFTSSSKFLTFLHTHTLHHALPTSLLVTAPSVTSVCVSSGVTYAVRGSGGAAPAPSFIHQPLPPLNPYTIRFTDSACLNVKALKALKYILILNNGFKETFV